MYNYITYINFMIMDEMKRLKDKIQLDGRIKQFKKYNSYIYRKFQ